MRLEGGKRFDRKRVWYQYNGALTRHGVAPFRGERYSVVLYKRRERMCVMCGLTDFCEMCFPGHSCCPFEPEEISCLAPVDSQQQRCPTCTHAMPIEGPWLRCTECPARVHEVRPFLDHEESCLLNCMWGCARELCCLLYTSPSPRDP